MSVFELLLVGAISGLVGGFSKTFLISERFTLPRKFTDHNGDNHILYGSFTELFLGIISGIIAVLPSTYSRIEIPLGYALYVALLAGLGGSSFIGSVMDKRVEKRRESAKDTLGQYDVQ